MLISAIRDEIIREVGGDTTDTELQALVFGFIKSALRRFPRHARNRMLRTQKSGTLSAAATTMAVPSGVLQVLKIYYEDAGHRIEIILPKLDMFTLRYSGNDSGAPQYAIIRGGTVEFNRKADVAYTVYFECQQEIDNVATGDTWAYGSDRIEIMKDGAKYYYYAEYVEDEEKGLQKLQLFKAGLDELEAEYLREEIPDHVEEAED